MHRRGKGLIEADVALPPDPSGRNRPASAGGAPLAWDANGNLIQKGDFHLAYDFRNRLTRVEDAGGIEVASYAYDVFNRRVTKAVAGKAPVDYVWSGLRSVEERVAGTTRHRRTNGAGLDEIVHAELDLDGDGTFETEYTPLYDGSGNLVLLTGAAGQWVGRLAMSPYGSLWDLRVDVTAAKVDSVLADEVEITLEISEEINAQRLKEGLLGSGVVVEVPGSSGGTLRTGGASPSLQNVHGASTIAVTAERPVQQGRQARRRIVLTPETPPAEGTQVTLTITPESLADLFLNEPVAPFSVTFTWPAAGSGPVVIHDSATPRIDQVVLDDGLLEIQLSEPIDLATTAAIEIDGETDTWTQLEDGYTIRATTPLAAGPHTLTVSTALQDLAGTGLAEPFEQSFTQEDEPATAQSQTAPLASIAAPATLGSIRVYGRPPADQVDLDTLSFLYGFHGRPRDLETGFVYFRNRYYDPDLGRFITADPLGYVDGPSQYLFAGYDPVNMGDPLGLCFGPWKDLTCGELAGSFNPLNGGFWKRSGSFGAGYAKGVGEVVTSLGVFTYTVTGAIAYDLSGSHVYKAQAEAADQLGLAFQAAVVDPGAFLKEAALSGLDQLFEAGARGDYFRAGEGFGRTVGQAAILAEGGSSLKLAPGRSMAFATGGTLTTEGFVVASGGGGALVSGLTLMADSTRRPGSGASELDAIDGPKARNTAWPWKRRSASAQELRAGGGNCKSCAIKIQELIGGEIIHIVDSLGAPKIGKVFNRRGELISARFAEHYAVRKGDMIFDRITGPGGMHVDDYRKLFKYGDKGLLFDKVVSLGD